VQLEFDMDKQSSVKLTRMRPGPFLFAIFLLCSGSPAVGQTPQKPITPTITLGIVAETHQKEIEERFREFVRYVARKIYPTTVLEGKIVVTATLPDLAKLLDQGTVDFYMESPYPTYVVNSVHGAGTLLLRRWTICGGN
jgi:ABC-type phosphate/phosphonate transport system substrate-binding protein